MILTLRDRELLRRSVFTTTPNLLRGKLFYSQLELFLLTVKLLCLQSLKALI